MKSKFVLLAAGILFSAAAFCQDSTFSGSNKVTFKNRSSIHHHTTPAPQAKPDNSAGNQHHIYRDTRLGSSSPWYNTYKKNDYGAGAITTNPHKGQSGSPVFTSPASDSLKP